MIQAIRAVFGDEKDVTISGNWRGMVISNKKRAAPGKCSEMVSYQAVPSNSTAGCQASPHVDFTATVASIDVFVLHESTCLQLYPKYPEQHASADLKYISEFHWSMYS